MRAWKPLLACLLLAAPAVAKPVPGLNDYGELLSPTKFSTHCIIQDPGISGSPTIDAYTHGQVNCSEIQQLYTDTYLQVREFLSSVRRYNFAVQAPAKTLSFRVLTLAELNSPDNFSETDQKCMYNIKCQSGAYFGRTFYSPHSSNINVYVVYSSLEGRYSFNSTIKHELMHAILYRYRWNYLLDDKEEHSLIEQFLNWKRK